MQYKYNYKKEIMNFFINNNPTIKLFPKVKFIYAT